VGEFLDGGIGGEHLLDDGLDELAVSRGLVAAEEFAQEIIYVHNGDWLSEGIVLSLLLYYI
jgi:hypothetical protein